MGYCAILSRLVEIGFLVFLEEIVERPIFKPIGTAVEELDTPVLVVDLDVMERNIGVMHSFFLDRSVKIRPRIQPHMCLAIAHKQLAAGGTVGGISVTTVGQAEVFVAGGITDIFVANVLVTQPKIRRLCALARHATFTVAVDNVNNINDLSEAAVAAGVTLNVVVGIDTGKSPFGVVSGPSVIGLVEVIRDVKGLEFVGLAAHRGSISINKDEDTNVESREKIQRVLDARLLVEKTGMDVKVVSVGGTDDYEIAASIDGVTEVSAGSYVLMDQRLRHRCTQFHPAAKVMASVTSLPESGVAITDGGQKAISSDTGLPALENLPDVQVKSLSAEHGNFILNSSSVGLLRLGDKVWQVPWDIGACVDLHDYIHGVRNGLLETVWKVESRGRYR